MMKEKMKNTVIKGGYRFEECA